MDDDSLFLLRQTASPAEVSIPLVLIHDGGGTVFTYFNIKDIGRDVFAIGDPRFQSSTPWEGGIPEMAANYSQQLEKNVPAGKVILGGWSFGGLVAFEMAKVLSRSEDHEVVGLVLIDSINPQTGYEELKSFRDDWNDAVASMGEELRPFVERSFNDTEKMARAWNTDLTPDEGKNGMKASPPMYVLRAEEDERARGADWYHSQGWEISSLAQVQGVVDLPGRHFGIFKPENIVTTTKILAEACNSFMK